MPPYRQCWNSNVDDKICYRVRLQSLPKECGEPTQHRTDKKPLVVLLASLCNPPYSVYTLGSL